MKTINIHRGTSTLLRLCHSPAPADDRQVVPTGRDALLRVLKQILFILSILSTPLQAQIQQAWVARYKPSVPNSACQPVKMALDSSGNIYVTGFFQSANSNFGYITIKYAPNGNQLWATKYYSTNYPSAKPTGLALDSSDDVFVTGTALTVKYDPYGNQLWTAPYVGTALAVDGNGNTAVTGISTSFGTVELDPNGSNLWLATYPSPYGPVLGPSIGQQVLVATDNSVYVVGSYTDNSFGNGFTTLYYQDPLVIRYGTNGIQLWAQLWSVGGQQQLTHSVQIAGTALDSANSVYVSAIFPEYPGFSTFKYSSNGVLEWSSGGTGQANGLTLDSSMSILIVAQYLYQDATIKFNSTGSIMWTENYPPNPIAPSAATAIAVDQANNVYVTGYSPGANSSNNIVTIKYDQNGNQIWLQRYTAPGNGNAVGNAIAVDKNGIVYVTGYETLAGGGTEIVTIKYSPVNLQRRADGTVLLQAQGSAGESFDVQASTNLQTWQDLGQSAADSNGLFQFDDTNAPQYNARFYLTRPQ